MTRYLDTSHMTHSATARIAGDKSDGREYRATKKRPFVVSVGKCLTPHAVNVEQPLVNGYCVTCRAVMG